MNFFYCELKEVFKFQAVKELADFVLNERKVFVLPFQKKNERMSELRRKYDERKKERAAKYQGINLYIKNLDDKVDDQLLIKEFSVFGKITSAKVPNKNSYFYSNYTKK